MSKAAVVISIKSDDHGRMVHLHDLNSQTTLTYIDEHSKGLIDVEEYGSKRIISHVSDLLEEFHFECYEFRPNPNGQNLKIFCKDNFKDDYIIYTVVGADPACITYCDTQQQTLIDTNTDGN